MAFQIVDRTPGGCTGQISAAGTGEAKETWTVVADSDSYTTEDVRQSNIFPAVYDSYHSQNPRLRLHPIEVDQDTEAPSKFTCSLTWKSDTLTPSQEKEKEDQNQDPLDRSAKVTMHTGKTREVKHTDHYGKVKMNTAGELFDPPPESTVTHRVIKIRKNVTVFPDWVFEFDDAVNSEPFTIKGRTIPKKCAWMASIDLGDINSDGPTPYCEATLEIHVKKRRKPNSYEVSVSKEAPYPWDTETLNEGFCAKVEYPAASGDYVLTRIKVSDPEDPSKLVNTPTPRLLDTNGAELAITNDPEAVDFVIFRDHEELDFNTISFLWST